MRILILLALLLAPTAQAPEPSPAIDVAKRAIVSDLDKTLPRVTVDGWLRELVGPQAVVTWDVNDCGEQTGDPVVDRGRDFPMCAEARVALPDKRTLSLSLAVGTQRRGLTGTVDFWSAALVGPLPNQMLWFKTIAELAQALRDDAQAAEGPVAVTGRVRGRGRRARFRIQVVPDRGRPMAPWTTGRAPTGSAHQNEGWRWGSQALRCTNPA